MNGPIGAIGLVHIVLFSVVLPLGAWYSHRQLGRRALPPRKPWFVSVIVQQTAFLVVSLGVGWHLGLAIPGPFQPTVLGLAAAAGLLAGAVFALRPGWRRQVRERDRRVQLLAPRDATERRLWAAISVMAGVGEEVTYRGVLFQLVVALTGSVAGSVALCSVAFGLGHLVQGWRGAAVVTVFAVAFHGLVLLTGSLHLAIIVHVSYDLIAGFAYGRYADAAGLPLDAPEAPDPGAPGAA